MVQYARAATCSHTFRLLMPSLELSLFLGGCPGGPLQSNLLGAVAMVTYTRGVLFVRLFHWRSPYRLSAQNSGDASSTVVGAPIRRVELWPSPMFFVGRSPLDVRCLHMEYRHGCRPPGRFCTPCRHERRLRLHPTTKHRCSDRRSDRSSVESKRVMPGSYMECQPS